MAFSAEAIGGGLVLLVASILAYWVALPRDGQVREFLRNEHAQAYYSVALVGGLVAGSIITVLGIVSLFT